MAVPMDEWGKGDAFRCAAADCGTEINLYLRAKIGFCNCTTGVSDDDELDRLSDFNLIGDKFSVLGPGHPITVAWMKGRSRSYAVAGPFRTGQYALAVAFNDHCDAIATVVTLMSVPLSSSPASSNSSTVRRSWAGPRVTLGLSRSSILGHAIGFRHEFEVRL